MSILRSHSELETLPGGKYRLTQHLKPIAYDHGGAWTRITNVLGDSGDPNLTIGVDELVQFRLRDRLAGNSPVFHFGKGQSRIRFTPLDTDNVQGIPVGDNGWLYPEAWPNADLQLVIGGHILRKNIYLRSGHPTQFAFRIDDHANFDPDMLSTPDFRIVNPVLENPAPGESIGLAWIISQQGGKYILTCNLPQGDYAGWVLDPTLTLQPDATDGKDAFLRGELFFEDTNWGSHTALLIGEANVEVFDPMRTAIEMSLTSIPANAIVNSAAFMLYETGEYASNDRTLRCFRLRRTWIESQVTWNSYSTGNSWQTPGGFGTSDCEQTDIGSRDFTATETPNEFKTWNLTAGAIQAWISGAFTNNGLLLKADTEIDDRQDFASSDHATAANRPKLVVEYTLPTTANSRITLLRFR